MAIDLDLLQYRPNQSPWINLPFDAGDFTASDSMTWTVEESELVTYQWYHIGRYALVMQVVILGSDVGGIPSDMLFIALPPGKTIATTCAGACITRNGGPEQASKWVATAGETHLAIANIGGGNFSNSSASTDVLVHVMMAVE